MVIDLKVKGEAIRPLTQHLDKRARNISITMAKRKGEMRFSHPVFEILVSRYVSHPWDTDTYRLSHGIYRLYRIVYCTFWETWGNIGKLVKLFNETLVIVKNDININQNITKKKKKSAHNRFSLYGVL
ncbi:hypothetical protein PJI17_31150, partial [Mycobacterium kansasii]